MVNKFAQVLLVTFVFIVLNNQSVFAQPEPPQGMKWKTVDALSDEFDSWNSSKWTKSLWNYGVPVQMKAENSGVTNGNLWIKATLDEGEDRWFETSRVMSKTQIKFPMYTECSMKTSDISAFSTFWMNNGNSENRDEIDICEHNSNPSFKDQVNRPFTMYSQYFIVKNGVTERHHGNFDNRNLSKGNPAKGLKWNEEFQTLGCWWKDENNIQFYINGEKAGSVRSSQPFTLKLNLIWDLWTSVDTWTGGIADKNDLQNDEINTMYIDWIHTYTLEKDESVNIEQKETSELIHIYPNPVDDFLKIKILDTFNKNTKLEIRNSIGQLVKEQPLTQNLNQISVNDLLNGVYFIQVFHKNSLITKSFIKG